jgi:hypothetical protein
LCVAIAVRHRPDAVQKVCGFPLAPATSFPYSISVASFLMLCFAICRIPSSTLLPTFLLISSGGTGDQYHKFTPPIHVSFFAVYSQWNCPGRVRFPFAWERGREAKSCCPISLSHIFISTVVPVVNSSGRKSGRYSIILFLKSQGDQKGFMCRTLNQHFIG